MFSNNNSDNSLLQVITSVFKEKKIKISKKQEVHYFLSFFELILSFMCKLMPFFALEKNLHKRVVGRVRGKLNFFLESVLIQLLNSCLMLNKNFFQIVLHFKVMEQSMGWKWILNVKITLSHMIVVLQKNTSHREKNLLIFKTIQPNLISSKSIPIG